MAATGLLLMRVADPENKSPAFTAFGYKQILFEPMVGGGLVTLQMGEMKAGIRR
ncbi:hypothetical protein ACFOLK_16090 [Marinococcus halophilus]|uniref:hypothetical protein n=1 Tax=Marinococcus halophilus TaxID=1371 RepID=UPI00361477B9